MVPLQVVLTAERPLTAGLLTAEVAFALMDVLDVDGEVVAPCEDCVELSLTPVKDDNAYLPASHSPYGQNHFIGSSFGRFLFGSDVSPTPESVANPPTLRSGERSGTWTTGIFSTWDEP